MLTELFASTSSNNLTKVDFFSEILNFENTQKITQKKVCRGELFFQSLHVEKIFFKKKLLCMYWGRTDRSFIVLCLLAAKIYLVKKISWNSSLSIYFFAVDKNLSLLDNGSSIFSNIARIHSQDYSSETTKIVFSIFCNGQEQNNQMKKFFFLEKIMILKRRFFFCKKFQIILTARCNEFLHNIL